MGRYDEINLRKVRRCSIDGRPSRMGLKDLAGIPDPRRPLFRFLDSLPDVLKARDLRAVARAVATARRRGRPVILMMGAHPVKCGLNPVVIDLLKKGIVTGLATNGAGAIHDFELACWGKTSEDVQSGLEDGSFGMSRETADLINGAVIQGDAQEMGFGESLGLVLNEGKFPHLGHSLLTACYRLKVPLTVHVAVGTDIVHQHPSADGAAIGSASHRDFRILAAQVSRLSGGAVINLGSSVVLPEVFLKALTVARNTGHKVSNFTAANFDMIQHYRPNQNVVSRPVASGGRGYSITGHHEIMLPLLAAMIKHYQLSR